MNSSISASAQLEQELRTTSNTSRPVATLRKDADAAVAKRDWTAAARTYGQIVVAAPRDSQSWFRLALVTLKIAPSDAWVNAALAPLLGDIKDDRERGRVVGRATAAAYLAYQRGDNANDASNGLILVGLAMAARANWDVALPALGAGLDLRKIEAVDTRYQQLLAQYGFRVVRYQVLADAASPSVCFMFSESLPTRHIDFGRYVSLAGQTKPTVSVDGNQLCVQGLKNGERYSVTLRKGLPSSAVQKLGQFANLSRDIPFNVYMSDRQPAVRFGSRAYVLPRTGQQGIPVISVNTDNVLIHVYRIGDRNLIDTVVNGNFNTNMAGYETRQIREESGVLVWSGSLAAEQKLNTEVTTAFPVDQAVPKLAPGVYAMTARPANRVGDDSDTLATQWFVVSDFGITAYSGGDGITAFVNSLATTAPKNGAEVRLMSRNNELLAAKTTDANGVAYFEPGLARGEGGLAPALLIASDSTGDYAFLSLKGPAFDLSDRGVTGREAPAGLDAFVFTERGVYRTGETVNVTALVRDALGVAAPGVPVTLSITRPDNVEFQRQVIQDQGVGARSWSVPVPAAAPTGTWRVRAYVDPKRPPIGQTSFLVEDYVPDRLEFNLSSPSQRLTIKQPAQIDVDGRFLYGAPASNLDLDGDVKIVAMKGLPAYPGYSFGLVEDEPPANKEGKPLEDLPSTDAQGKAKLRVAVDEVPDSTGLLQADIDIRMSEPGGRAVQRTISLPIVPSGPLVGIKPLFNGKSLNDGATANFDVIMVNPDGTTAAARGLRYQLLRVENHYQMYKDTNGIWQFEAVKSTRQVNNGQFDVAAATPGRISLPLAIGRYRLEVYTDNPDGPTSSVAFDAGWYTDAAADTPDYLEIALDKPEYRAGDTMNVAVTAPTAGKVTVAVIGDKLLTTTVTDVQPGVARVPVTVGNNWGSGAYVVATFRRPLDVQAGRMPGRSLGVQWFSIDRAAHTLAVDLKLPDLTRPRGTLHVPVKISGIAPGEEARVVVSAVDVGILNLTNYKPPAPDDYYLGQRRLAMEIRDLYGQLIDGMQGTRGPIKTGGDTGEAGLMGSPPTQPPLALYSGIVTVDANGAADIAFDIPDFAGTARVMAVAWSKDKVGRANGDVTVRDPVVVTATLPRFLLSGDKSTLRLDLDNVEGQAGDYRIAISGDPIFMIDGANSSLTLAAQQRNGVGVSLSASGAGTGNIVARITGPGGIDLTKTYALSVRPASQILARRTVRQIAMGESLTLSNDLFADFVPGTGKVAVSIGPSTALDSATLLEALERYPFACSEQLTSRVLPLLYVSELLLNPQPGSDATINQTITRLLTRETAEGAFLLWPPVIADTEDDDSTDTVDRDDIWLDAYVTDFLTRARERHYSVPDIAFKLAVDHLRNYLSIKGDVENIDFRKDGANLAYVYYVLARNKAAPLFDLRYIYDQGKLANIPTAIARAQIAAAFAMLGDGTHAGGSFDSVNGMLTGKPNLEATRSDYGSDLRDAAAVIALASESGALAKVPNALERIAAARSLSAQPSTNEEAWMLLAARGLADQAAGISLNVAGTPRMGPLYRTYSPTDLGNGVTIGNTTDRLLQAVVTVSGAPIVAEPAVETQGFKIERLFYSAEGKVADPSKAKQNQRFVVVLKVTETKPQFGHVMITDFLPAGLEIDNPDLVSYGKNKALPWIDHGVATTSTEFRDDRFTAAIDRKSGDDPIFMVAYTARAVSPGHYVVPQARVDDMYRPDRFGRTKTGVLDVQAAR